MKSWRAVVIIVVILGGAYALAYTDSDRVGRALEPSECPAVEVRENFGNASYKGKLIDTHIHIPHPPDGPLFLDSIPFGSRPLLGRNINIEDFVCTFRREGTSKVFAFFPVFEGFEETHLSIVSETMKRHGDLFVPFIMPPQNDDRADGFPTVNAEKLKAMLKRYPGLFRGYGEIGLYERGDHGGPKGSAALPPDSRRLREIYPVVRKNNLIVYFHLGEGQQESFERALSENPDINFIFHGDQLIKYEQGRQNLGALDEILHRHSNAFYGVDELYGDVWLLRPEISKKEFVEHFREYEKLLNEDTATWKAFIERHPDQVLWGTDRGWSAAWSMDPEVGVILTGYARAFISHLAPSVREKFAYRNAERLLND